MANEKRNEVTITLTGEKRTMRATFAAIEAIETQTGKSIIALNGAIAQTGDISVSDAVTVICHGLRGFDDVGMPRDKVGEAVVEAGLHNVIMPVIEFMRIAMNGVPLGKPQAKTEAA